MVSSKTIENLQWSLQNHWNLQWFPKKHWTCQWSSQINILLKQLNYPVVTFTILIWLCCSKVYCQSSLIFIAAHCSYKPNQNHCWPLPSKFWKPSKNHWFQWLDPPKNIQWWWSPQKPLKICNGLFTFLDPRYVDLYAFAEDVLQRIVEDISRCYLIFHSSLKYLDMILSSFGDMILTRDSIVNLKTIVDHCPQNFENHRKTIGSNGWTPKKHSMVMVQLCQNHWKTIDGNGGLKKKH